MLPKATVPEGSRKVLNGVEVYTRHNFTTERGNFFETMGGEYILPNGQPVEDRSILESLPEPQRQEALTWWDQRFGGVEKDVEIPPAGKQMTKAELRAKAQFLLEQADMMEDEEAPEQESESTETIAAEHGPEEQTEPASGRAGQSKDAKESKLTSGRSKKDRGTNVLAQMGIAT